LVQDATKTDSFFKINQLKIQWQNRDSIFSSASDYQLYQMSVANGLKADYNSWSGRKFYKTYPIGSANGAEPVAAVTFSGLGGLICCEVGKDIPVDTLTAPGSVGAFSFSATLSVTNISGESMTGAELYIITATDGLLEIYGSGANLRTGLFTPTDILNTIKAYDEAGVTIPSDTFDGPLQGGDFWSNLTDSLSSAHDWIKKNRVLSRLAGATAAVSPFIPGLNALVAPVAGVAGLALRKYGYGSSGGAVLNRNNLKKMSGKMSLR
jgi:hypothetical protein